MAVKYPDNELFLYRYNDVEAEVVQLPKIPLNICSHKEVKYISDLINDKKPPREISEIEDGFFDRNFENPHKVELPLEVPKDEIEEEVEKPDVFLNSKKYLSDIKNKALIENVKNHTITERAESFEEIKKQLMQHLKNVAIPIYRSETYNEDQDDLTSSNATKSK